MEKGQPKIDKDTVRVKENSQWVYTEKEEHCQRVLRHNFRNNERY